MYKTSITYNGSTETEIFVPASASITGNEEQNEVFFRRLLDAEMIASGAAFDLINDAPFTAKFSFLMEKRALGTYDPYEDYFPGTFFKRDCRIDEDQRAVYFKVEPNDKYTPLLDGLNTEFNALDTGAENTGRPLENGCSYDHKSRIQIAMKDWIENNDDLDNKWKLITSSNITTGPYVPYARHFAVSPPDETWTQVPGGYAFEINDSDPAVSDIYDGVFITFLPTGSTPPANSYLMFRNYNVFGYDGTTDPPGGYLPIFRDVYIQDSYTRDYPQVTQHDKARLFWDTLKYVVQKLNPNVLFDLTTDYSDFFFNATNPLTGQVNTLQNLRMLQKSDAIAPFGTDSKAGQITFQQMLEVLKYSFGAYWFIDGQNRFRVEHVSYFRNGGVYLNNANPGTADPLHLVTDADLLSVDDIPSEITYTSPSAGVHEFLVNTRWKTTGILKTFGNFKFDTSKFTNKNFRLSFKYKIDPYVLGADLTGDDFDIVSLFVTTGGVQDSVVVDPNDPTELQFERYYQNLEGFDEIGANNLRVRVVNAPRRFNAYYVDAGTKLTISDIEIQFFDVERQVGLDLTKMISLKNGQNALDLTNNYEYEYQELYVREVFKYQDDYNRFLDQTTTRETKVDTLLVNYADGEDTEWIPNSEESRVVSVFIAQLEDYLQQRSPNSIGWVLLDCNGSNEVVNGFIEWVQERNASLYWYSLYLTYGRFRNSYQSFLLNDKKSLSGYRYNSASLQKIKVQGEISGLTLDQDIDPLDVVKTNLGNGELKEFSVNLNTRSTVIVLRYDI